MDNILLFLTFPFRYLTIIVMAFLFMRFAQIFVLIQVLLYYFTKLIPQKFKNLYIQILSSASILLWLSIFLSRQELGDRSDLTACFSAGFPFQVFVYPCHPMGGDYVPLEYWFRFYLSYLFWMLVSAGVVFGLSKTKFTESKRFSQMLYIVSGILSFGAMGMLMLYYD